MQPAHTSFALARLACRSLALLSGCALSLSVHAQSWSNPGTGDWFTGTNWDSGVAPDNNGIVTIDAGTATLREQAVWVDSIFFGQTASGSEAKLSIDGSGGLTSNSAQLGYTAGTNGVATVSGAGSQWTITSGLTVGLSGNGSLSVNDEATLNTSGTVIAANAGSESIITVADAGSQWNATGSVFIGGHGIGRLRISQGATVSFTGDTSVAWESGSTGSITLSDAATSWNIQGLLLGYRGTATLAITDGATVANTSAAKLGVVAGSLGSVELERGGHWTNTGDLDVGFFGDGIITLRGGSELTAANATLGADTIATGSVTLEGGSSWTNSGDLIVGMSGQGDLRIYEGSAVSNADSAIGYYASSQGAVEVGGENSLWTNTGSLYVGVAGAGRLTIHDGGRVSVGGDSVVTLGSSGEIEIGLGYEAGTLDAATVTANFGGKLTFNHSETAYGFSPDITGTVSIVQAGPGRTILSGANTFSGFTTISDGTLAAGGINVLSARSAIFINNGATLDLAGYDQTVGDLDSYNFGTGANDSGTVILGGATLTNLNRVTNNWAGSITGAGTLVKQGDAIMNWYGTNTFTGVLQVDAGTLVAQETDTLSPNAVVAIAAGAAVQIGDKAQTIAGLSGAGSFTRGSGTLTINQAADTVFSGVISGWGTLVKAGAGILTLSGENFISGSTSVEAGALIVDGALMNTVVSVKSGATLGGSGRIEGLTTIETGAHLAAGGGDPGMLTFTDGLALDAGAILDFELGSSNDLIHIAGGGLSASGTITVNLFDSGGFTAGTYTLIDASGAALLNIGVTSFELGTTIAGYDFSFSQVDNQFLLTAAAVPEPASFAALAGLGVLVLAAQRRRSRAK